MEEAYEVLGAKIVGIQLLGWHLFAGGIAPPSRCRCGAQQNCGLGGLIE